MAGEIDVAQASGQRSVGGLSLLSYCHFFLAGLRPYENLLYFPCRGNYLRCLRLLLAQLSSWYTAALRFVHSNCHRCGWFLYHGKNVVSQATKWNQRLGRIGGIYRLICRFTKLYCTGFWGGNFTFESAPNCLRLSLRRRIYNRYAGDDNRHRRCSVREYNDVAMDNEVRTSNSWCGE